MPATTDTDAAQEARLRRLARRQGFALMKSRCRTPEAIEYGRFWIIDPDRNWIVAGAPAGWTLDDVEDWPNQPA